MKFNYYGHSCFLIEMGGKRLLFDPFITGNPLAKNIKIKDIGCDFILVSHGHVDHTLDLVPIASETGSLVICSWEIHEWLNKQGIANTHPMNTGGKWAYDFGTVKCFAAQHSSGLPDGSYGGNPLGFVIKGDNHTFYYSGDTALTLDMQLVPKYAELNFSIMPVGDNFTMGPHDAMEAAKMINCRKVIGVHFDTFGYIKIDHTAAIDLFRQNGIELILLAPGDTLEL